MKSFLKCALGLFVLFSASSCLRRETERFGCLNEDRFDFENECKSIKEPKVISETGIAPRVVPNSLEGPSYRHIKFNPLRNSEISFFELDDDNVDNQYISFVFLDMPSGQKASLSNSPGFANYCWDDHNNLFFIEENALVKINKVTEATERVEIPGSIIHPSWIPNTNEIGMGWDGNGVASFLYYLTYDFESGVLDTFNAFHELDYFPTNLSWTKDRFVNAFLKEEGLAYYDPIKNQKTLLVSYRTMRDDDERVVRFKWHPDGERLYYCIPDGGIFYTSIGDKKEVCVKKSCGNWLYTDFDISGDGSQIIAVRQERWSDTPPKGFSQFFDSWIYSKETLRVMDVDGCNEQIILSQ